MSYTTEHERREAVATLKKYHATRNSKRFTLLQLIHKDIQGEEGGIRSKRLPSWILCGLGDELLSIASDKREYPSGRHSRQEIYIFEALLMLVYWIFRLRMALEDDQIVQQFGISDPPEHPVEACLASENYTTAISVILKLRSVWPILWANCALGGQRDLVDRDGFVCNAKTLTVFAVRLQTVCCRSRPPLLNDPEGETIAKLLLLGICSPDFSSDRLELSFFDLMRSCELSVFPEICNPLESLVNASRLPRKGLGQLMRHVLSAVAERAEQGDPYSLCVAIRFLIAIVPLAPEVAQREFEGRTPLKQLVKSYRLLCCAGHKPDASTLPDLDPGFTGLSVRAFKDTQAAGWKDIIACLCMDAVATMLKKCDASFEHELWDIVPDMNIVRILETELRYYTLTRATNPLGQLLDTVMNHVIPILAFLGRKLKAEQESLPNESSRTYLYLRSKDSWKRWEYLHRFSSSILHAGFENGILNLPCASVHPQVLPEEQRRADAHLSSVFVESECKSWITEGIEMLKLMFPPDKLRPPICLNNPDAAHLMKSCRMDRAIDVFALWTPFGYMALGYDVPEFPDEHTVSDFEEKCSTEDRWHRMGCCDMFCHCWGLKPIHPMRICRGCRLATYCSALCQTRDWPIHKEFCQAHRTTAQDDSEDRLLAGTD